MVPLPPYARRVEYLESTGTQWIDTGVRGAGSGYLATKFMAMPVSDTGVYWRYFGASNGGTPNTRTIAVYDIPTAKVMFENGTTSTSLGGVGEVFTLDKQPYRVPEGSTVGDYNFKIFGYNASNNMGSARFWYFKLWNSSDQLVRSFVPCRILDTGYLWDEVEGKFYGNQGTGDFVLGPDVREGVVPTRLNPFGVGRRMEQIRRVEYLESTGTQWIDTGVYGGLDTVIDATVEPAGGLNYAICGSLTDKSAAITVPYNRSANVLYARFGDMYVTQGLNFPAGRHNVVSNRNGIYLDGALVGAFGTSASFTTASTLLLFGFNGLDRNYFSGILARCSIYDGSTLVRDFVPVAIGSVGYLLDRVSGRLFGNQGTGDFVVGPDVVPVEYVRSNDGPHVRTGIVPSNATRWDMKFSLDAGNAKMGIDVVEKRLRVIGNGSSFSCDIRGVSNYTSSWETGVSINETSIDLPNKFVSVNGTTRTFSGSYASNDLPLLLFGSATGATSADARSSTIYWCKIYESGTLVRDFIPVRVGTDGALYDKVTDTVFRSATSTPLVAGPDLRR